MAQIEIQTHLSANVRWNSGRPKGSNLHESVCKLSAVWGGCFGFVFVLVFLVLTNERRWLCVTLKKIWEMDKRIQCMLLPFAAGPMSTGRSSLWGSGKYQSISTVALIPSDRMKPGNIQSPQQSDTVFSSFCCCYTNTLTRCLVYLLWFSDPRQ